MTSCDSAARWQKQQQRLLYSLSGRDIHRISSNIRAHRTRPVWIYNYNIALRLFTDSVSQDVKTTASVRPSFCLFPLHLLNRITVGLAFVCVCWGGVDHDHSSPAIESQGHSQGQRAESSACGRGNAVGLISILDQGQFFLAIQQSNFDVVRNNGCGTSTSTILLLPAGIFVMLNPFAALPAGYFRLRK